MFKQCVMVFFVLLTCFTGISAEDFFEPKVYTFSNEPIDVVIPTTDKDLETLNLCIEGIRENCKQVRRIIVVSSRPFTDKAEWFDEAQFPFSKNDLGYYLLKGDQDAANRYVSQTHSRVGWYYQQLLKLYSPFVIPGISSNVLIIDSDTVFINPVEFMDASNAGLYNPGCENHPPYFVHAHKLLPGLKRMKSEFSGISHHMLFQRPILEDLFNKVEKYQNMPFWQAFCLHVDHANLNYSGASEYEIYFNFAFAKTSQVQIRRLNWTNSYGMSDFNMNKLPIYKAQGYHYISIHHWVN